MSQSCSCWWSLSFRSFCWSPNCRLQLVLGLAARPRLKVLLQLGLGIALGIVRVQPPDQGSPGSGWPPADPSTALRILLSRRRPDRPCLAAQVVVACFNGPRYRAALAGLVQAPGFAGQGVIQEAQPRPPCRAGWCCPSPAGASVWSNMEPGARLLIGAGILGRRRRRPGLTAAKSQQEAKSPHRPSHPECAPGKLPQLERRHPGANPVLDPESAIRADGRRLPRPPRAGL